RDGTHAEAAQPAPANSGSRDLTALREQIDGLDERLAALLQERAILAFQVQRIRGLDSHGHDVARERELLERAARGEAGPLTPEELTTVFSAVVRVSRAAQRRQASTGVANGIEGRA
ncbi:MAG: chorismate mutase, partial [Chloroflexota bacterium]